ncbi:MAG: exo-alpha-sialidase [Chloroflexi bacterium]|nr:MAG: exo-alpha-sialidase [Chloroflexota bacterium]
MGLISRSARFAALGVALLVLFSVGSTSAVAAAPKFGTPVRLPTFKSCGGYEPGIALDKYGNIFVTAHKQNHCDAVALDPSAPIGVRAQSWMWTSTDGVNWNDMPGLNNLLADPAQLDVGDEGDIALDDANHFYFVDTKVVDDSFTRWTVNGPGTNHMTQDIHRPVIPSLMPIDDRPWVTAHGATTVMYAGNEGDKDSYDVGSAANGCTGPVTPPAPGAPATGGRYTVFMSHDAGASFDPVGCTLPDSGWCRPAADHKTGSPYLYMFCTNDSGADDNINSEGTPGYTVGTLWSYVSADNGASWKRYKVDSYNSNFSASSGDNTWPAVTVAKNGYVYALFANPVSVNQVKTGTTLNLYRSTDHGAHWSKQNVTPANAGLIRYSWMSVAGDGHTIGVGYFTHQTVNGNWHVYAGTSSSFGSAVSYSLVDPVEVAPAGDFVFGDFFEVGFDSVGRLNVVYTRCTDLVPGDDTTDCLNSDIYFARTV